MSDSFQITQNEDGSYTATWDKQDPKWSWLNGFTAKELQIVIEQAIKADSSQSVHQNFSKGT